MSKTDNINDYFTALGNSFRIAMGSNEKINAQKMLELPPQLANGYEDYKNIIQKNFTKDQDLYIPEGITRIGQYTYSVDGSENNTFFTYFGDIHIPEGVEIIGKYAFSMSFYKNIYIPKSLKTIENGAFSGYRSNTYGYHQNLYYNGTLTDWMNIQMLSGQEANPAYYTSINFILNGEKIENPVIPKGIELPSYKYNLSNFQFDTIKFEEGSTIEEIGRYSLGKFRVLYVPKTIKNFELEFNNNTILEEIHYEGSLAEYVSNVQTTSSGYFLYYKSRDKKNVKFFVNKDEEYDFSNGLIIPEGVTIIKPYTLYNWPLRTNKLVLPSSLNGINTKAINLSTNDVTTSFTDNVIVFKSVIPPTIPDKNTLPPTSRLSKIVVPKGTLETFKTATNYTTHASIMVEATTNTINVDSSLMNNANILYSADGSEKQQFTSSSFVLEDIGTLTIYNNETGTTIKVGTTNGGSEIGTSTENTAITYTFTNDGTIYITKA